MTKELESLETYLDKRIKDIKNYLEFNERSEDEEGFTPSEELQICYLAKRMLAIDNAKPSEALECLHKIARKVELADYDDYWEVRYAHSKVEQALIKAQEQEKVLKILKEKNVNIGLVKVLGSVEQYNQTYVYDNMRNVKWCLTQEEFDLLKRYFK